MNAADLLRTHISLVGREASDSERQIYSENVVMTLMYAPEGHTRVLEGPDSILRFMNRIGDFFSITSRPSPSILVTEEGAVAEYRGDMICLETGLSYHQDYVAFARVEDGRIVEIREYYDPIRVLKAFGEM